MGSPQVILIAPGGDLLARIVQGEEPVDVQALGPEASVEGLDEGVIRGLAGLEFHSNSN